ncbi:hypothetical protein BSKO_02272 [Bryopsis sp. KO-2023]|nr:hypothetical protein BSKO_02272 [Bryopsis sp. KO-2023]
MKHFAFLSVLAIVFALACARELLEQEETDFESEVQQGVLALRALASTNLEGVKTLKEAIASGDLDAAKKAYIRSRPEYEQIEVLAGSFEGIDSDIDARAYAFDNGEAVKGVDNLFERGAHFQGFHRIEALIFRDGALESALPYADDLIKDSEDLLVALGEPERFNAQGSFGGMIGLSTEVAAKKMSSEEETYSDMSILIFHNNYLGVESQYRPFAEKVKVADPELAEAIDSALESWLETLKPHFSENEDGVIDYAKYTSVDIPARAAIQAGAYKVADLLRKAADALNVFMGEGEENVEGCEGEPEKVFDGESEQIKAGLDYFRALMPGQIALVDELIAAIEAGDLDGAKKAYTRSRPPYEQIEVLAVSFLNEDSDIDARPYAFELGEFDEGFKGFHKLERQIYRDEDLGAETLATAKGLASSMQSLDEKLNNPELFNSVTNFEGMIGLATEVPGKKISSEEEVFSGLSILIFYNNWKGIYSQLKPFLKDDSKADAVFDEAFRCLGVTTNDVWNKVSASDVTEDFVKDLADTEYPVYDLENMELRECVVINAYKIRDVLLELSQELGVFVDCHPFHESSVYSYRHKVF